jgi:hypothetical protein
MEVSNTLDEAFDLDHEEGTSFELLPNGKYVAEVTHASVGPTKAGNASMISLTWTVAEGEYEKRLVFQTVLVKHGNPDAQRIGRQRFKDVCFACGVTGQVTDLDVLLYKPCAIVVGIEKDKTGNYPDKNRVTRVAPLNPAPKPPLKDEMSDTIPF